MTIHRRRFTLSEKVRILGEQDRLRLSNGDIYRRFGVQNGQLASWRNAFEAGRFTSRRRKSLHSGPQSQYAAHEVAIKDYILGERNVKAIVNVGSMIRKLAEFCQSSTEKSYKSRQMWAYRFISRNRFSIRRVTRNVTLSDDEMQRRRFSFLREIEQRHSQCSDTIFVNMDQVSVVYGDAGRFTITHRGATSVQARTGLLHTDRATVALAVASNGEKLDPLIVFKGTQNGRIAREFSRTINPYPHDIHYMTNQNAWMTGEVMVEWIEQILMPFSYNHGIERICLILDSFSVHRQESIRTTFSNHGIHVIYIPGGMTGDLQPLDVGINAPFKHYIHEAVIIDGFEALSASERRFSIAQSVSNAFSNITVETVINSFNRVLFTTYDSIDDADEIDIE